MADKKYEPTLADLGLDAPVAPVENAEKISIARLQRESEAEEIPQHRNTVSSHDSDENLLGVVGFTLSIISFVMLGCMSPIALIVSGSAMSKQPRGLATAGVVLSGMQTIFWIAYLVLLTVGFVGRTNERARLDEIEKRHQQAVDRELREKYPDMPPEGGEPPLSNRWNWFGQ